MKQLNLAEIRTRLASWLDPGRVNQLGEILAVPFGRYGTTPAIPVMAMMDEGFHGNVINPSGADIMLRRQGLTPGVYDVWWDFSVNSAAPSMFSVGVEDASGTARWGTGFTSSDNADQSPSQGWLAFMVPVQDDEIVFRTDNAITGNVRWNAAIIQRIP